MDNVDVFPISSGAFGIRPDWFDLYSTQFIQPSYLLMGLLIVVSVGLMAIRRFENANFEKKLWGVPVIIVAIFMWPSLVLGLKSLIDTFNAFLLASVFRIPWRGFGFPNVGSASIYLGWSAEGFARLLPNLAYWIIYTFYIVFFFFYAVLGPFIIAKGVLNDEIEGFLELAGELTVMLLWQTTIVVLVAFLMPEIVSGQPFPAHPRTNLYLLSLILGIMILFVPSLTRKFVTSVGSSFMPLGFRWGGAFLGLTFAARAGGSLMGAMGFSQNARHSMHNMFHNAMEGEEFAARHQHRQHGHHLEHEVHEAHEEAHELAHELEHAEHEHGSGHGHDNHGHGGGHSHDGQDHHHGGHDDGHGLWSAATHAKHDHGADHG
jgi:hypothetical protein